jgi:hypothetical protein
VAPAAIGMSARAAAPASVPLLHQGPPANNVLADVNDPVTASGKIAA